MLNSVEHATQSFEHSNSSMIPFRSDSKTHAVEIQEIFSLKLRECLRSKFYGQLVHKFRKSTVYPKKARNVDGAFVFIVNDEDYKQVTMMMMMMMAIMMMMIKITMFFSGSGHRAVPWRGREL